MKRVDEFYLDSECGFIEDCLKLLGIKYTKDINAKKDNFTVSRIEYEADDDQYEAITRMFMAQ